MEQLSAMMDGELEEHAIDAELRRSKGDPEWEAIWGTYHLIGDALRGEFVAGGGMREQVQARLANEPTVLAPRTRKARPAFQRVALPLAASLCGIAVVAWLALANSPGLSPDSDPLTLDNLAAAPQTISQSDEFESDSDAMNEYLMAHQQFSPSTAMQGVASYVRTVSAADSTR